MNVEKYKMKMKTTKNEPLNGFSWKMNVAKYKIKMKTTRTKLLNSFEFDSSMNVMVEKKTIIIWGWMFTIAYIVFHYQRNDVKTIQ